MKLQERAAERNVNIEIVFDTHFCIVFTDPENPFYLLKDLINKYKKIKAYGYPGKETIDSIYSQKKNIKPKFHARFLLIDDIFITGSYNTIKQEKDDQENLFIRMLKNI